MIQHPQNVRYRTGRIIRMKQLVEKLSLSDSHIYALINQNQFPKPFTLVRGGRAAGWYESDIDAWIVSQMEPKNDA